MIGCRRGHRRRIARRCRKPGPAKDLALDPGSDALSDGIERKRGRSQAVNQAQDVGEQASRDCDLGKLERDIATVADDLGADLDELLAQARGRPMTGCVGHGECRLRVNYRHRAVSSKVSALRLIADLRGANQNQFFLSVCILADQVREFMQVGDHGIGLDRGVIRGRFNMPLTGARLLRRLGRRLAFAVGRHQRRLARFDEIGVLALDVAETAYLLDQPGDLDRRQVVIGAERRQ